MGPSLIGDGNRCRCPETLVMGSPASLGPSLIGDGNRAAASRCGGEFMRFNGAVPDYGDGNSCERLIIWAEGPLQWGRP